MSCAAVSDRRTVPVLINHSPGWLDRLDALTGDPHAYRATLIEQAASIGFTLSVAYERSMTGKGYSRRLYAGGEPTLAASEGRNKLAALMEHAHRHGMRGVIMAGLEVVNPSWDQRANDPRALAVALRDHLSLVGLIYLDGNDLKFSGGMPTTWGRDEATDARIEDAFWSFHSALRLPGAKEHVKRVVRKLGSQMSNGMIVLRARS